MSINAEEIAIREAVKSELRRINATQSDLAENADVTAAYVSKVLSGEKPFTDTIMSALARMGISLKVVLDAAVGARHPDEGNLGSGEDNSDSIVWDSHRAALLLQSMRAAGVQQVDLAREAGVSTTFINKIVHGRRSPSRKVVDALVELGIELPPSDDDEPTSLVGHRPPTIPRSGSEETGGGFEGALARAQRMLDELTQATLQVEQLVTDLERARAEELNELVVVAQQVVDADESGALAGQATVVLKALLAAHRASSGG